MKAIEVIFGEPWLITETGLSLMIAVASRDEFFDDVRKEALAAKAGTPLDNTRSVTVRDGVAVIPVMGPLFRHANIMTRLSGATSYSTLRTDLQAALDDASVRAILLQIDSPGGDANGVAELADAVFQARAKKEVVAYVGGTGASAAYWIASAASMVVAAPTAELGSIGAVMAMMTEDAETAKRRVEFVSSNSPDKRLDPTSKAGRAAMQRRVDDLSEVFVDMVARNRAVTKADVLEKFGRGGVMIASRAVAAGLADKIGDFESTLAQLAGKPGKAVPSMGLQARGAQTMNKIIAVLGLAAAASEDDIVAAITEREKRSAQALDEAKRGSTLAVTEAEKLSARLAALENEKWEASVDKAVADFRLTPAEAAEHKKLAGVERQVAEKLMALRQPMKPAPAVVAPAAAAPSGKGTAIEGLNAAQLAAVEEFKKSNPGADDAAALMGAASANPALFSTEA